MLKKNDYVVGAFLKAIEKGEKVGLPFLQLS